VNQPYGITYQIVDPTEPGAKATLRALKGEGLADVGEFELDLLPFASFTVLN